MDLSQLIQNHVHQVTKYFLEIVRMPTQADPEGLPTETLQKFMTCANFLAERLQEMGLKNVRVTKEAYVLATLPSSLTSKNHYTIALMAHYDTALDNPGDGANPLIHKNYSGGDLKLPHNGVIITAEELSTKIRHDVITSDGLNQLGADDKAGVAAILDTINFYAQHPEVPRPTIQIIFNNNEEVGQGVKYLDYQKLDADYAYCVDAGTMGKLYVENFYADAVDITITGITVHPGYAKDKMISALTLGHELHTRLMCAHQAPEESEGSEPYLGFNKFNGDWTEATMHYLLRGFKKSEIKEMRKSITGNISQLEEEFPGAKFSLQWEKIHTYKNAGEVLVLHPLLNIVAKQAYELVGVTPIQDLTRGGFDGVNMSFEGLPTTDVFNGAENMHGLNEFVTVQDLETTTKMLIHLTHLWSKQEK